MGTAETINNLWFVIGLQLLCFQKLLSKHNLISMMGIIKSREQGEMAMRKPSIAFCVCGISLLLSPAYQGRIQRLACLVSSSHGAAKTVPVRCSHSTFGDSTPGKPERVAVMNSSVSERAGVCATGVLLPSGSGSGSLWSSQVQLPSLIF